MCFACMTTSKGGDGSVHVPSVHNHSYGVEDLGSLSLPAAAAAAQQALADKL